MALREHPYEDDDSDRDYRCRQPAIVYQCVCVHTHIRSIVRTPAATWYDDDMHARPCISKLPIDCPDMIVGLDLFDL